MSNLPYFYDNSKVLKEVETFNTPQEDWSVQKGHSQLETTVMTGHVPVFYNRRTSLSKIL